MDKRYDFSSLASGNLSLIEDVQFEENGELSGIIDKGKIINPKLAFEMIKEQYLKIHIHRYGITTGRS